MSPRQRRYLALYAPSIALSVWAVLWSIGLRSSTSDVVMLITLVVTTGMHTYVEIKYRRRR